MRSCMAVLFALAFAGAASAQTSTFVITLGKDTIALEAFTRTANRIEGELSSRMIGGRLKYALDLANGAPVTFQNTLYNGVPDTSVAQAAVLSFKADSVFADITSSGKTVKQRMATKPGAFPFINLAFSLFEPVLAKVRGAAESTIPLFAVMGGQTFDATVKWVGSDSAVVSVGGVDLRLAVDAQSRITGGVVPAQNVYITRAAGALSVRAERPDYSAPAGAAYTAENILIKTAAGQTIGATLTLPKSRKGRVPVVVTISGSGLQDRDEAIASVPGYRPFRQIAAALAEKGIGVLRYDDRGIGESTGNAATATSKDFADDTRSVLAHLREREDVDEDKLFLLGHSEGGMIAPLVAADAKAVRGVILMAGTARTGRRILEFQNRYLLEQQADLSAAKRDSLLQQTLVRLDSVAASQPWLKFFMTYDPVPTARGVKSPVLILQGAHDQQVTADQAGELAAAFRAGGNKDVTVYVVPGVNHLFLKDATGNPRTYAALADKNVVVDVLALIGDWVVKHAK